MNLILGKRNEEEFIFSLPVHCFLFEGANAPQNPSTDTKKAKSHPLKLMIDSISGVWQRRDDNPQRDREEGIFGKLRRQVKVLPQRHSYSSTNPSMPPVINRSHHPYGTSTVSMRNTDAEEREFMQRGFRFWLKEIKELRWAGVLGGAHREGFPGGSLVKDLAAMQQTRA